MPQSGYPSGTNTYVPSHEASQMLVVGYSRNPGTFKVAGYTQYIKAKNNQGLYYNWGSTQAARVITATGREFNWADGDAAPEGSNRTESGFWSGFTTVRKAFPFTLGGMAVDQASFPLIQAHAAEAAQTCMTVRTMLVYNALSGTSWGNNTAAVDGGLLPAGNNWATGNNGEGTNQGPNIFNSIQQAIQIINLATMGVITYGQLTLVVNPRTAGAMARSTEIRDYLKQSQYALGGVRLDVAGQNGVWGLPDRLYNVNLVVEDCVRISSHRGATDVANYVLPDGEAYLLARQGEIDGVEGTRSYSTCQVFFYKDEMTAKTFYDGENERYKGRVVQNMVAQVVSPISGFKFSSCLG